MSSALLPHHLAQLTTESGIALDIIKARGYRSIHGPEAYSELKPLGFSRRQSRLVPGLLVPFLDHDGKVVLHQFRPDTPQQDQQGKPRKYETPAKAAMRLDFGVGPHERLENASVPLWLTEGIKKVDSLISHGFCAVGLAGVWNFKGKNRFGGITFLPDWDYIALNNRQVRIVYDNDVMTKPQVRKALKRLTEHMQRKGAHVTATYLPTEGGKKVGADDYLREHTIEDLEGLIEQPRPEPQPAAPIFTLLPSPRPRLTRPLMLIDGQAYAATWLPVQKKVTERLQKDGTIIKLSPPEESEETHCFIIRDDGTLFGDLSDPHVQPLRDLGLTIHLPEVPRDSRLWSGSGVTAYRVGYRADAAQVFGRVVDVVDYFIDFSRSLATQRTMAEFVACYILASYFLDAFTVIGFLWPNGDRGSGKTQLLNVVTELGYLGETILAGGSYACLRDLADYGATLAFDDAEQLSDPKRTDPDKRALLLAGNRKGNTVPVKEPGPNSSWRTRYVSTFCPRLFSAIRVPDAVLASRAIVVPLIRTADPRRANADPMDYVVWPHDRAKLKDDLWALALANLPEMPTYVAQVNKLSGLQGRNLEPWRPLLAVARWLEDTGVEGIGERMESLSLAYQTERADLETEDPTRLLILALWDMAKRRGVGVSAFEFETAEAVDVMNRLAQEAEIVDSEDKVTNTRRIGWVLKRLRFKKATPGRTRKRWKTTVEDITSLARTYGMHLPVQQNAENGENAETPKA